MKIRINGKEEEITGTPNIADLLNNKGLCSERVVVEHNLRIIQKEELQGVVLNEDDTLEIISFVGGG